ncbi:PTS system mannose/fructose/sorbose family transporter subunit IID [Thermoanaerobacter wiegelii]|uniref:PTS system mannose/fructose/sorbose family IID component n=1 Tax=Thermoanaerobacter wiegelii Rt8.B1 TaxID=697303 RepID=G2MTU7_9THEO|nr:PTS system mannose/fructose/sorbose family transporter subunit IID [Thermoanaerobacter wiegelii]AEM79482.1 PTS system mannose/fructose/sorbose family IID component [Thermoanaerobacter wiegelii Rt8.B1]
MSNSANVKKLEKKDLIAGWWRWLFFNLSSMSFERLESFGFCHSMIPIIKKLYDKKEDQIAALKRHSAFYNTEPQIGSIVNGIVAGLEEAKANGEDVDEETIQSVKVGLMGPLAGIGDSLIPGMLIPILLSIGMGLASGGSVLGPIFYIVTYNLIIVLGTYYLYMKGYSLGLDSVKILIGEQAKRITESFIVLGMIVIGGIAASYVNLSTKLVYKSGNVNIEFQKLLDNIFPHLLPFLLVIITWYLMSRKNVSALKMMIILLITAIVGVLLGIF